jgi:intracellular septation protein
MNGETFLLGILPLLAFVVIDSFAGMKSALWSAIGFAILEVVYSLYMYQTLDALTIGSFVLVLLFAFFSYRSQNPLYFKMQPVALGVSFAFAFLVFQWMGKPLLIVMLNKYQPMIPSEARTLFQQPNMQGMLGRTSHYLGWGFLLHGGLVAYSALKLSNWWWLLFRGIGVYVMMGICMWAAR